MFLGALTVVAAALATWVRAERPRVYALTNVRIVTAPGQEIEQGTIVLREGLIEALGSDIEIPADAQVIEGQEGWTVYPAFIDAAAQVALKQEEQQQGQGGFGPAALLQSLQQGQEEPTGSPHEISLIRPEKDVVEDLDFSDNRIERHRKAGFAVANVLPSRGILKGRSAVVALRSGEPQDLIIRAHAAQVASLQSGNFFSGYPTSKMGAIAAMRQAFHDARRQTVWVDRYRDNPVGMQRPRYKTSDEPLMEAVRGRVPVLFTAGSQLDYRRFKMVADEFGLTGMATGEGLADRPDDVMAAGMPVLLPLNMPDKPKLEDEDEQREVGLEEMQTYLRAPRLPRMLQDAGVEFAFVTLGMDSVNDVAENLHKIVEEGGLSQDAALAALTTVPARLLGVDAVLGSLEAGKIANLIVVEGDLFAEKPEWRYLFVDGVHEEFEVEESKGDPNAEVDPRGEWEVTTEIMGRSQESTWTIEGSPGNYSGTSESDRGSREFESVELEGNLLRIQLPGPRGRSLEAEVVIKGDSFEGESEINTPRGSITIKLTGKRTSKPQGGAR
ncbi:MAG TPA: amidohydrolase family protein [Acidobacteriota bacterium]|nr:amidohydrolase family protein [Acidobacteriota bacterium]